ncbi:MAG: sigma-70 family RNA polymerase sigma factor [Acidobacteriaceae bacterium]
MATSPGSNVAYVSPPVPLSVLPALKWMPLPSPKKQTRGTAATAIAATQAASDREQVLLEHLPLVRMAAYRILERLPQQVEFDDLVSAGVMGLIDAYNKFDPSKKVLFRSYAAVRIREAILDSLRGMDWAPRELRRKAREIEETTQRLIQRMGRKPQQSEVAAELGMAFASFQKLPTTVKGLEIGSLQGLSSGGPAEEEMVYVEADPEDNPLRRYMRSERAANLSAWWRSCRSGNSGYSRCITWKR